jgi:hypothetical protein
VLERELQEPLGRPEENDPDLALIVLQGEIGVAGLRNVQVRNLSLDPDIGERAFEEGFNLRSQLRDGEDVGLCHCEMLSAECGMKSKKTSAVRNFHN